MTLWTIAHWAPLSMGFSRQEYWSGLTIPFSRDLPNPGIEPRSPALQVDSLPSEPPGKLGSGGCHIEIDHPHPDMPFSGTELREIHKFHNSL